MPAVMFTDIAFTTVVNNITDLAQLQTDWAQIREGSFHTNLPRNYFTQWPSKY